jgi:8-oxo-dGTP diphosphatase
MIQCTFEDGGKGNLRHVVTDALVLKDRKILLGRRAPNLVEGGKWSLPGGYVNLDETLLESVEREILEETGYKVSDLALLRVVDDPNRMNEDRQNIAFVYYCKADKKKGEADKEVTEQKWFSLDALPNPEEMAFDHLSSIKIYLEKFPPKV